MRHAYSKGNEISVYYPNATHFAFNPAIVEVYSTVKLPNVSGSAWVTISMNGAEYTERRELPVASGDSCVFDIQRYLQLAFADIAVSRLQYNKDFELSPLSATVSLSVYAKVGSSQFQVVDGAEIAAIWGAVSARETNAGAMRRKWFVGYPFTLDIYAHRSSAFDVSVDGNRSQIIFYPTGDTAADNESYYRYLFNVARVFDPAPTTREIHVAIPHSLVLGGQRDAIGIMEYTVEIECQSKGVYLRWIDRQGRYCYYLLRDISTTAAISASATWEHNDINDPTQYVRQVNIETPTRQLLRRRTTRTLGVKLVDSEMFDFLLTLAASPVVDVFDGYDEAGAPLWHRVNVVPANFEKSTRHLQDFTVSIEEPTQDSQIL